MVHSILAKRIFHASQRLKYYRRMGTEEGLRAFVSVGSTAFTELVSRVCSNDILEILGKCGFRSMIIQHGNTPLPAISPDPTSAATLITVTGYPYKPSIKEDMIQADLIIAHAGSGSIVEALRLEKALIVVINAKLQDNHQSELADQLHKDGYLLRTTVDELKQQLEEWCEFRPVQRPFPPPPHPSVFRQVLIDTFL